MQQRRYNVAATSQRRCNDVVASLCRLCCVIPAPPGHLNYYNMNMNNSNPDGSFTFASSNLFLSPYTILPIAPEKKNI